jgi:hypothetical protein
MIPTLRVFESEKAAKAASDALAKAGFSKRRILSAPKAAPAKQSTAEASGDDASEANAKKSKTKAAGEPDTQAIEAEIARAKEDELLARHQVTFCRQELAAGRVLLSCAASFGYAGEADAIMRENCAIEAEVPSLRDTDDPSPFSDALGIPVLSDQKPSAELTSSKWTFSSLFGIKLLSDNAAPLSSATGMKTVIDRKRQRDVKLSDKAAPLSSALGMKTLTERKGPRNTKLSHNPAPFSSALGIPVLTKKQ